MVVALEPNHLSRGGVFVAAFDRILQTGTPYLGDFIPSLRIAVAFEPATNPPNSVRARFKAAGGRRGTSGT